MEIICLGLNHKSAPVEVRERFAVSETKLGAASRELSVIDGVNEGVVISTCNRTEFYLVGETPEVAIEDFIRRTHAVDEFTDKNFYLKRDRDVADHLCRVVSGMDSMVLGETEIAGQVKRSYEAAHHEGATKGVLNRLFQKAFSVAKKVRNHTAIQRGQTSVGSVAVDLAEKIFGNLKNSEVMVIGAGEMSRTTAQSLVSRGAKSIFVTNRSYDKAVDLAQELGGEAIRFDDWEDALARVDVVISSTGAPHAVVLPEHVERVRAKRKYRPLFFVDIAMPRDISPNVAEIDEVYVYDLDKLSKIANEAQEHRLREIEACENIIDHELVSLRLPGIGGEAAHPANKFQK